MSDAIKWTMRDFTPDDQDTLFDLINKGLAQRFNDPKPEYNPDLYDIQAHYIDKGASVIVVESDGIIIGCGALIKEHGSDEIARIVRVSVRANQQGKGLGRAISERLIDIARERNFEKILVETNDDWTSALNLYLSCGFTEVERAKSPDFDFIEVHMEMVLK